jgi:5-methylcytosine-specific restriction endonuclease McrA
MAPDELEHYIRWLIDQDKLWKFYKLPEWLTLRTEVMEDHNWECQDCKKRGYHARARSVHHEQWVRSHPRLALSKTYEYQGKTYKNLIPLCEACHNKKHKKGTKAKPKGFINEERW